MFNSFYGDVVHEEVLFQIHVLTFFYVVLSGLISIISFYSSTL